MTISSWASALAKKDTPNEVVRCAKAASGSLGAVPGTGSYWAVLGNPLAGSAPTTAAVPTNATTGAIGQQNGGSLQLRIAGYNYYNVTTQAGSLLIDRLSHQGGLDATVTGAQTTNLPTAALTRYTGGVGVKIGLLIYTIIGATASTITVSYTNSGGTPGRTSQAVVFGATGAREVARLITIPLQSGDVGVRSVENVNILASTLTAGNFGVILYKEIMPLILPSSDLVGDISPWISLGGYSPEIFDNACLEIISASGLTSATSLNLELRFAEDDT